MATIEDIRGLASSLKGYQFKIVISNAPGSGAGGELLEFRCQSTVLPGRDIDQVLTSLGGFDVAEAGRIPGPRSWTTTFIEGTDAQILERIESWQELCFNPETGVQAEPGDYKRTARVQLLNNSKEVIYSQELIGIWPQSRADMALDSNSSEAVNLDVTWSFDYSKKV